MFSRTNIFLSDQPAYGYAEVKEYKAPTDDAVRLLREMETKAQEQILKTVRLENNILKAVIHLYRNTLSCDVIFVVQVEINGKRLDTKISTPEWLTHEEKMTKVFSGISDLIAGEVLNLTYKDICQEFRIGGL